MLKISDLANICAARPIFCAMATALATLAIPGVAMAADLTITLNAVQASTQKIYVSIQKKEEFLQPTGSFGEIITLAAGGTRDIIFKNVTPGEYSVSVWHDSDGDGVFTMASNGMPLDGWGMYKGTELRGMPAWDAVKFTVPAAGPAAGLTVPVTMVYPAPQS